MLCDNIEGWEGRAVGRGYKKEGTYVCLWLIHVGVWQKPSQYCKVIVLQLKNRAWSGIKLKWPVPCKVPNMLIK